MNTEEKAKAYDKGVKEASIAYKDEDRHLRATLERIFPELKESEDERMRKEIIQTLKRYAKCVEDGHDAPSAKDWYVSKVDGKIHNIHHSVDKAEPKFQEGDFIVAPYCRGKIIALTSDAYLLDTGQGIPFSCEYNVHLWTIEDAKDGDMLIASDESIFIYAGSTDRHAKFYLALTKCGKLNVDGGNWEDKNSVHPATKEQRDALFAKMKEAGYEWDAEKKALKKIEQKPTWGEEDEKKLSDILAILRGGENCYYNSHILIDWLKSLKKRIGG